jgi:hypothetical protein
MLATMLIAAKPVERWWCRAAVVREGNDEQVYVEVSAGQYRLTKVKLGPESDGMRVVQSGIKPATAWSWKARSTWTTSASAGTGVTGHDDIAC